MFEYIIDFFSLRTFLIALLIFLPLERLLPMRPDQKVLRENWKTDLVYAVFNGVIIRAGLLLVLLAALISRQLVPQSFQSALSGQPLWLQLAQVLIIADLGFYAAHRMFHRIPFLWRIHQIHHSIQHLDWLAGSRVHPIDQIITKGASLVPVVVLGYAPDALIAFALLYQWQSVFLHANLRIGFGPLRLLFASPEFHHWHHASDQAAHDRNFAAQLPFIDVLFGTLHMPRGERPENYGIDQKLPPTFIAQMLYPLSRTTTSTQTLKPPYVGLWRTRDYQTNGTSRHVDRA